jgi:hypothetical protein
MFGRSDDRAILLFFIDNRRMQHTSCTCFRKTTASPCPLAGIFVSTTLSKIMCSFTVWRLMPIHIWKEAAYGPRPTASTVNA